jgi:hypothetical protein
MFLQTGEPAERGAQLDAVREEPDSFEVQARSAGLEMEEGSNCRQETSGRTGGSAREPSPNLGHGVSNPPRG